MVAWEPVHAGHTGAAYHPVPCLFCPEELSIECKTLHLYLLYLLSHHWVNDLPGVVVLIDNLLLHALPTSPVSWFSSWIILSLLCVTASSTDPSKSWIVCFSKTYSTCIFQICRSSQHAQSNFIFVKSKLSTVQFLHMFQGRFRSHFQLKISQDLSSFILSCRNNDEFHLFLRNIWTWSFQFLFLN